MNYSEGIIMSISSADFNKSNNILFRAKIVHSGFDKEKISKSLDVPEGTQGFDQGLRDADVIDVNNNGKGDADVRYGTLQSSMFYSEPVLAADFESIEKAAGEKHTEIITEKDMSDLQVKDQGLTINDYFYREFTPVDTHFRSLNDLVHNLKPGVEDAQWAIDAKNREFLIYRPFGEQQ